MATFTARVGVSAHLLAATGAPFQGWTAPIDGRNAQPQGRAASTSTGIALDRNPIPRGTPMI
jgi:hypothetical protein